MKVHKIKFGTFSTLVIIMFFKSKKYLFRQFHSPIGELPQQCADPAASLLRGAYFFQSIQYKVLCYNNWSYK